MNFLEYCETTIAGIAWAVTVATVIHLIAGV